MSSQYKLQVFYDVFWQAQLWQDPTLVVHIDLQTFILQYKEYHYITHPPHHFAGPVLATPHKDEVSQGQAKSDV